MDKDVLSPLAYGYAENGNLYTELHWTLMERAVFQNTIGKDLVNFAFLDDDTLLIVMQRIYADCSLLKRKQPNTEVIADVLLEKYEPWFQKNTYLAIYLMGFLDYLATGRIDKRVFPGTCNADRELWQEAGSKHGLGALAMIDLTYEAYQVKRELAEAALQVIYEDETDGSLSPLERYFLHEQEDPDFRKLLHATFTTKLGRRGTGDRSVTQMTVLDAVDDLLRYELFLLVTQGRGYKFCKNCGKPFIPSGRSDMVYCDRIMDGADKPCRVIGANLAEQWKIAGNPVLNMYRMAYQRLCKRVEQERMTDEAFVRWKEEASQKRDLCLAGELSADEFSAWIDQTSRQR